MPKNSLADFVSATPSVGATLDACTEPIALMSCTEERMTATIAWPESMDCMTVGPKREATATTDVWR